MLSSRAQVDRPAAATFNIMNGCRGTVYETNNTVTTLTAGTPFDVEWVIQAPHPGTMVLSVVKPSTDTSGTITYKSVAKLLTIDPFAESSNENTSTTATIPSSVTGCGSAGDCALQFYWHSDLANQTYPTCADIVVSGSGESTGQAPTSATTTKAPGAATSTPTATTATPTVTTNTPVSRTSIPTSSNSVASDAEGDDEDCGSLDVAGSEDDEDCGSLDVAGSEDDEDCGSLDIAGSDEDEATSLGFDNLDGSYVSGKVTPRQQ
ncbi:Chitin-binding protein [Phytophthora cinnamomi]|uniref:Chitin-binding protein n=1 Tax=Phytophthora cinnamomi TaxID=4785 RepID=UPI00355A31B5|nr:Chitin-binding protein [Phytophthora cinnamomi]